MIDLHTHSTASDGTVTPEELVSLAAKKGLTAIALTDHDTVAALPRAMAQGEEVGVEVIPGVELSAGWSGNGQMHILGYYIDYRHRRLVERLRWLRVQHEDRARKILNRLRNLGIPVSWQRVEEIAGGGAVGRPHIARALVYAGRVGSFSEAFKRCLKNGASAFVEKSQFTSEECIGLVRAAGGVAVPGHPATLKLSAPKLESCVRRLVHQGLEGIEAYWSEHSPAETALCQELSVRFELICTGGSDFHGSNKPGIELGQVAFDGQSDADIL